MTVGVMPEELGVEPATALTGRDVEIVAALAAEFAGLGFIDSSGLGVLVAALKRLREDGGDLKLRSPTPAARKVLEVTGLTKVFTIT